MWGSQLKSLVLLASLWSAASAASSIAPRALKLTPGTNKCKGYSVRNVKEHISGLSAELRLIGKGCGIYGPDLPTLRLDVNYDTKERLHVKIADPKGERYQVPEFALPRPTPSKNGNAHNTSDLVFKLHQDPFAFTVSRRSTGEKLFDTAGNAFVFEEQYLRLAINLDPDPNIYGLGEHTENFRLPNRNLTRTLWNRDAYGVPEHTNLYGAHPIYFEQRKSGTHGVFLLNSNGMDVKLDGDRTGSKLEYNVIGGILDFYFLAGPTPKEVAQQYAAVVGKAAIPAYWGLGNHQCRYGYRDWYEVAEVIANYSSHKIPLETMWTDIDYMDRRRVFSLDPERFPLGKMQEIVNFLHNHNQKYIMMVDPAVAYADYPPFQSGVEDDVFLKNASGGVYQGVVWPGVAVYPDWFHPNVVKYWSGEFERFFNPKTGVDIDGSWIDMNEPSNFCVYPCLNPKEAAMELDTPPAPPSVRWPPWPRLVPGFVETYAKQISLFKRAKDDIDYINPPYAIQNTEFLTLSNKTVATDVVHHNGLREYDTHNLYGTSMSTTTYDTWLNHRPGKRPFVITRSTFAGAGHKVGKWLGDNISDWWHYRNSIAGVLGFASIYQVPLVGADVCGFGGNTTDTLCARWTTLGAFHPFYRNHDDIAGIPQEPFLWPIVASAARKAIGIRYQLLDYLYTSMWRQSFDGTPSIYALWFEYPQDAETYGMDLQFFFGPSVMVAPVTQENSTSVDIYLPDDVWYDYISHQRVSPGKHTLKDIAFDEIPLYIKGGSILPLRQAQGAMTTEEVRRRDFELLIVPGKDGMAKGELYVDDGESLVQEKTTHMAFEYAKGSLRVTGNFDYPVGVKLVGIEVLDGRVAHKVTGRKWDLKKNLHIRL